MALAQALAQPAKSLSTQSPSEWAGLDRRARVRDAAGARWRAVQVAARRRYAAEHQLPQLLILGAQRGGTTSLYKWLAGHPQVNAPLDKEIQFFSVEWHRGTDWYRSHFGRLDDPRLNFEASPYYLYHPCAPARVAATLPGVRMVALLREPVARAWSHYHHNVSLGLEPLSFAQAVDAEDSRLAGEEDRIIADPMRVSAVHRNFSYLDRGRYRVQLERWRSAVDEDRLLVLSSDALFRDPNAALQRVLEFCELDRWRPASFENGSRLPVTSVIPGMDRRLHAALDDRLADDNRALAKVVEFDLDGWAC
jgi:hypothetical protein